MGSITQKEAFMFVRQRMTPNPVTVAPKALLSTAREKMTAGKFRRLPVVQDGVLVGILTDRDLRQYVGVEERTRIEAAMTETSLTIAPTLTVEEATQVMRKHQVSGLPMLESGQLVGIITTSDIVTAFLELTGAIAENSLRVHLAAKAGTTLTDAAHVLTQAGGEVLGIGTEGDPTENQRVFCVRVRSIDATVASTVLRQNGYTVLNIQ
jgi:acetoin utilization protein AcuB